MKGIIEGITMYLKALPVLAKPKYFKYVIYSGLLSVVFYCLAFVLFWYGSDAATDLLTHRISTDWLRGTLDIVSNIIVFVGLGALLLLLYKHIVLIICGPIIGKLSEAIEKQETSSNDPDSIGHLGTAYSTYRGIRIVLRNIVREIGITSLLLILTFTPLAFLSVPLIFIVQAYYAGFGNLDIYLGRHLRINETISYVRSHRLFTTVNGSVFLLILLIPIVGAFLAPAWSATAATLRLMNDEVRNVSSN